MSSDVFKRLRSCFGANTANQVVTILSQIILIPCMLQFWGKGLYAEWIVLYTIPSYFAIADIGIGTAAGNQICMLSTEKEYENANVVFQSALVGLFLFGLTFIGLLGLASFVFSIRETLNLNLISQPTFVFCVVGLSLFTLFNQQQVFFFNCFRCDGNATLGTYWIVLIRLVDFFLQVVLCWCGGFIGLVASLCIWRIAASFMMLISLKRKLPWLELSVHRASFSQVKKLLPLGMSFMAFPIGNAIVGQGMVLLASMYLSPLATVVLATHRTLVSISTQFMNTINYAFWPELTTAYGMKNYELLRRLHRLACRLSVWGAIALSTTLFAMSWWLIPIWTRNEVDTDLVLMAILLVSNLIRILWYTSSIVAVSTNQHSLNAKVYLFSSIASMFLVVFLFSIQTPSLHWLGIALIPLEIAMLVTVIRQSLRITNDRLSAFLGYIFSPSININAFFARLHRRKKPS